MPQLASSHMRQTPSTGLQLSLSDLERAFLTGVANYPDIGIAERYKRLAISVRQGQKLKAQLVSASLIRESEEHTRTGRLRRIRLTEEGNQSLSEDQETPSVPQE